MSKSMKLWLVIAVSLMVAGSVIFGCALAVGKGDWSVLSTSTFETREYAFTETFSKLDIEVSTADVEILPSESSKTTVICREQDQLSHSVRIENDTLRIEVEDTRAWYDHIGIFFDMPKITISLPVGEYVQLFVKTDTANVTIPGDFLFREMEILGNTGGVTSSVSAEQIRIATSTGSIHIKNMKAKTLDLAVSTGSVTAEDVRCEGSMTVNVSTGRTKLTGIRCETLETNGNTGDLIMTDVVATKSFQIKRSTGDVRFDGCDAAEIVIKTDTGDVSGTLLTQKLFLVETDTGSIDVPKTTQGGECRVETDTGDIRIGITNP